jgi:hypothetical protein
MTEFDSPLGCVWRDEAPAEALADWIIQKVDDNPSLAYRAKYEYDSSFAGGTWWPANIELTFLVPAGLPNRVAVFLTEPALGVRSQMHFERERFGQSFPTWLRLMFEGLKKRLR